ncbi:ABC transporter ATP-binding protein [Paracoccus litorisediminis]|uniref:Nickel ABC transporter ATP-binding protein NikE n=1 Tax=Paracoccus litorisediminis TaxID=2006130 RepID=A0A844HTI6_9RHOB|nr:ABC transporter ATP-binding protein [Paracoccus litorisediminis]MTH60842.1 nickel ABC transporter ATP-binding protein NikE [Paracoccus litorisediminis]
MSDPILRIRNLQVTAPDGRALTRGIDVDLAPGEVLGLIGESGAGKSTIGLAALGYGRGGCRISGGTVEVADRQIVPGTRRDREQVRGARVAYVAQSAAAAFNPAQRLGEQMIEAALYHGTMTRPEAEAWRDELIRVLQLPNPETFPDRYPHQVSGGQLQRAMIAMAMACRPDILVLDEPTTALDVTTQIEVLVLLRGLIRRYGTAALYITHDLAVVAQISDRIMVLRHGELVEQGTAQAILEAPQQDYTRRLVAERGAHERLAATRSPGAEILSVERLKVFYGHNQALHDVSLTLGRGETLAIVGESGSGKSTLARAIAGLPPFSQGRMRFDGAELPARFQKRSQDMLRRIQLVYQLPDVALNPRQTIAEIIGRPLQLYFGLRGKALAEGVARLLADVGLPADFAARLPGALSGGQKQRVCVARALAAQPDLIICDEVTSALDPLVAEEVLQLLARLQQERGLAYLFITHDLGVVRRIADRTLVMQKGRVVEEGPTETIFTPPWQGYTGELITSVPEMRRDWLDGLLATRGQALETAK